MQHESPSPASVQAWIEIAREDLRMADKGIQPPEAIGAALYHCQQEVEKMLKAYLVQQGTTFPHTHDLRRLVELCENHDESFVESRSIAAFLAPFSTITRYPGYGGYPSKEDAEVGFDMANEMFAFVLDRLPRDVHPGS